MRAAAGASTVLLLVLLTVCVRGHAAPQGAGGAPHVSSSGGGGAAAGKAPAAAAAKPPRDTLTPKLQKGPRRYVIFTDCDEDDTLAITIMAIQQALYANIEIAGIVIEDGFLSIDQGLRWMTYWMTTLFPQLKIPIVAGYPRGDYLRATRVFPASWVSEYTGLLSTYYPGWSNATPPAPPETPDQLAAAVAGGGAFSVLSIGPTTTLPALFDRYPAFLKQSAYVVNDLGSIVPHLIYPGEGSGFRF